MGGPGSGKKPREYPPEIVALAISLYEQGMTISEISAAFPPGYRVQTIIERHVPERRKAIKRDQRGEKNHAWRGDAAGYQALHLRVRSHRGIPETCVECGSSGPCEWANLTGRYEEVDDYASMCRSCHRRYDRERRAAIGALTSTMRKGVVPNV